MHNVFQQKIKMFQINILLYKVILRGYFFFYLILLNCYLWWCQILDGENNFKKSSQ